MMRKTVTRYLTPVAMWAMAALIVSAGMAGCSYLPFMKSTKAPEEKKVRTLWQSGEQYVAIEKQDRVPGVPEKANEHVSEISVDRLRSALASMEIRSQDADKSIAMFNEDELRILSEYIAEGLAVAGPDEDVTFAIIGHYVEALGFLKRRMVTTGRVFCQDGQLNIIFGDVHRLLTETMGRPEDRRLNPFAPGSRAGSTGKDMKGFLLPKKDGEVFAKMREDWVIFPLKGPEIPASESASQESGAPEAAKGAQTTTGQAKGTPPAEVRTSAPAAYHERQAPAAKKSVEERLMQLNDLRSKKLLTDEEYKAKRMEILNDL